MVDVIRSVSKRQLRFAAKVSTRTIPTTLAAANEMPDAKLRWLFGAASSLVDEKRKTRRSDELLVRWLAQQVAERGAKAMGELLGYDAATIAKVVGGKRKISKELRQGILARNDPQTKNRRGSPF